MDPGRLTHGTEWAYSVHRCRCRACKTARAYASRAYRRRRKARTGEVLINGRWAGKGAE